MGFSYADIKLSNPRHENMVPIDVKALADTSAIALIIPDAVAKQLKLDILETREVITADGKKALAPYAGPVLVRFQNRHSFSGAYIMGDQILLGAIQMEDMDLVVSPRAQKVTVNPESPDIARAIVK